MAEKITKRESAQDFKTIYEMYLEMKAEAKKYKPLWDSIAKFSGIGVDPDYIFSDKGNKSDDLDAYVDDPTSALSVNQQSDYMIGIVWGTGDGVFQLRPSRYVLELAEPEDLADYYDFITEQVLYHMNHSEAGLHTALRAYMADQAAFGTSGIGAFPNNAFKERIEDHANIFRSYGIDNMVGDEGKSGKFDKVGVIYRWKLSRILSEFCTQDGAITDQSIEVMPDPIKQAYKNKRMNEEFNLVYMQLPRENYDPKLRGVNGTRYRGVWFMDSGPNSKGNNIFYEEAYHEKPIAVCRQIKVRGQVYGRSSGTMLNSTIRAVNFLVGLVIEITEKMSNPALGMFNSAILGDAILDSSPNGLTIFNQLAASSQRPVFPLHDVGDPSEIVKFIIPYLNEKITTAFKIDLLLDFSSAKNMTATESLKRYAIRGKSLSGMLQQQKIELLEPLTRRCISILDNMNELGYNADTDQDRIKKLKKVNQAKRIIPPAVLQVKKDGRAWFDIRFNNELEKLTRTEAVEKLIQVLQTVTAIAAVYPQITMAVDWYKFLNDINNNLDGSNQILIGENAFKAEIDKMAKQQAQIQALQAGQAGASMTKDLATAGKTSQEAQNGQVSGVVS